MAEALRDLDDADETFEEGVLCGEESKPVEEEKAMALEIFVDQEWQRRKRGHRNLLGAFWCYIMYLLSQD